MIKETVERRKKKKERSEKKGSERPKGEGRKINETRETRTKTEETGNWKEERKQETRNK